ncbi:YY1-associated factor 2-like [Artemia franciscana]|uniref:YY1-associated factor 2-like n=1 Tax=Artemia franciscana TaxID=6661 RepID=UPI0032DA292F
MDKSPQSQRKNKRPSKNDEDFNAWDCSVCTYKNTPEAFKCLMCDGRKGTSTRKPRPSTQVIQTVSNSPSPPKNFKKDSMTKRFDDTAHAPKKQKSRTRLKNIDRKSAQSKEITVNNVTVVITEYKLKKEKSDTSSRSSSSRANSDGPSGDFSDTSSDTNDI